MCWELTATPQQPKIPPTFEEFAPWPILITKINEVSKEKINPKDKK